MEKLYYSISEVADILGESVSLVRFWSNSFSKQVKPKRNGKGNRQYSASDIEILKQVHHLVREQGLTLEGAEKVLKSGSHSVGHSVKVLESLREIRAQLVAIKDTL